MFAFLQLIRLPNLLIIAFTQCMVRWCLIHPILKVRGYELQLNNFYFFLLVISTLFIAAAGYIINDYFDLQIDKINKPEKVFIENMISKKKAFIIHLILNILGLAIGFWVCYLAGIWKLFSIHLFWVIGLWYYSKSWKKKFLIGNLMVALFIFFVPVLIGLIEIWLDYQYYYTFDQTVNFTDIRNWIIGISSFAFLITLIREIVKDIEDYEGDKTYGCKTMPILLGIKKTKMIIVVLALFLASSVGYLQYLQFFAKDFKSFYYFLFLIQIPLCYLMFKTIKGKEKKDFGFISKCSKLIMISGLCYLFLFTNMLLS